MSPTVFRFKGYRFFFFSREEERLHVHVASSHGEAKFWLEPMVSLAENYGMRVRELKECQKMIEVKYETIKKKWQKHFGG